MNEPIRINKSDVEDYVRGLDSQCQEIYRMTEAARVGYRDTLDDEFQILCEILDVFGGYALRRKSVLYHYTRYTRRRERIELRRMINQERGSGNTKTYHEKNHEGKPDNTCKWTRSIKAFRVSCNGMWWNTDYPWPDQIVYCPYCGRKVFEVIP